MVILNSIVFFILWIIFSGRLDPFHLGMGVFSSIFVAIACRNLMVQEEEKGVRERLSQAMLFPSYLLWLIGQILKANIHVLRLAFASRVREKLDPQLVSFDTVLSDDLARFILANSITLTPGTVVVRIDGTRFMVHAISKQMAQDLPGEMEDRLVRIFEKKRSK